MSERKMATVRRIDKIEPIEGADKIVKATVGGWQLVTAIDNGFKEGDLVVYLEIDSWVPTEIAPFLSKGKEPREYLGIKGEKLRSIKLRGCVSQGLLLPLTVLPKYQGDGKENFCIVRPDGAEYPVILLRVTENMDVSEILGIVKYDPPLPVQLAGMARGNFPSQVPKTNQERVQNLSKELNSPFRELRWEVTEKMEGSSATFAIINNEFHVCSRNLDLKHTDDNTFWKVAIQEKMEEKLRTLGVDIAIQLEICGPGIQGNIYNLPSVHAYLFDVYDIPNSCYYTPENRRKLAETLAINHVPVIYTEFSLEDSTMDGIIVMADGKSVIGTKPNREGIVFKATNGKSSWKAISNKYLLGQSE